MQRRAKWLTYALLLAMLIKGLAHIWHEPMYAYANNFDQVRMMVRYGIAPDDPRFPIGVGSFAAPLIKFHLESRTGGVFYRSTDQSFVRSTITLSKWFNHDRDAMGRQSIDVRWKGTLSFLVMFAGLALVIRRALHKPELSGVAIALAAAAFFLTDPFNMMYAPTWYLEFSALIYAAIGLFSLYVTLIATEKRCVAPYIAWVFILLFGAAKYQYQFFPIGLAVFLLLFWRARFSRVFLLVALASAFAVPSYLAKYKNDGSNRDIAMANASNSLFNVFLRFEPNKKRALEIAGLPPACEKFIGTNWFIPDANADKIRSECPQISDVPQSKKLEFAARYPRSFVEATITAVGLSQSWLDTSIGHVAGQEWGKLREQRSLMAFSFGEWVEKIPPAIYAPLYLLILGGCVVVAGWRARVRSAARDRWTIAYTLCGLVGGYAFICAYFGEGFNDINKHAHLSYSALTTIALIAIIQCLTWARRIRE